MATNSRIDNINFLKKIFYVLATYSTLILPTGFIVEVINNTDQEIKIEYNMGIPETKICILECISLKNNQTIPPFKSTHPHHACFASRTRNIIEELNLPICNPAISDLSCSYDHTVIFNFDRLFLSSHVYPEPFFGMRQVGDLLQIVGKAGGIKCIKLLRENNHEYDWTSKTSHIFPESNEKKVYSSIEINQLRKICYKGKRPNKRRLLPCSIEIIIRKIDKPLQKKHTGSSNRAVISNFSPGSNACGFTRVSLEFEQTMPDLLLEKACNIIRNHPRIKNVCKVTKSDRRICVEIYSNITRAEFDPIFHQANVL